MKHEQERRQFLQKCLSYGIAITGGSIILSSCGKKQVATKTPEAQTAPVAAKKTSACSDMTGVDPAEVEKRKALGYVDESPLPDKQCDNCKLWVPAKEGKECGGCLLFAGPVAPGGHCTYWADQV